MDMVPDRECSIPTFMGSELAPDPPVESAAGGEVAVRVGSSEEPQAMAAIRTNRPTAIIKYLGILKSPNFIDWSIC